MPDSFDLSDEDQRSWITGERLETWSALAPEWPRPVTAVIAAEFVHAGPSLHSLTGAGSVGKTAVALQVGSHLLRDGFQSRDVLYLGLRGFSGCHDQARNRVSRWIDDRDGRRLAIVVDDALDLERWRLWGAAKIRQGCDLRALFIGAPGERPATVVRTDLPDRSYALGPLTFGEAASRFGVSLSARSVAGLDLFADRGPGDWALGPAASDLEPLLAAYLQTGGYPEMCLRPSMDPVQLRQRLIAAAAGRDASYAGLLSGSLARTSLFDDICSAEGRALDPAALSGSATDRTGNDVSHLGWFERAGLVHCLPAFGDDPCAPRRQIILSDAVLAAGPRGGQPLHGRSSPRHLAAQRCFVGHLARWATRHGLRVCSWRNLQGVEAAAVLLDGPKAVVFKLIDGTEHREAHQIWLRAVSRRFDRPHTIAVSVPMETAVDAAAATCVEPAPPSSSIWPLTSHLLALSDGLMGSTPWSPRAAP